MSRPSRLELLRRAIVGDSESSPEEVVDTPKDEVASGTSELTAAAPLVILSALLSALLVIVVMHFTTLSMPNIVVFDIIKYVNSQRAVASRFLSSKNSEDAATTLMDVSKHTKEAIAQVAGPNAQVFIKQSLIQGNVRDITDEVLKKLGLPTDVPTSEPTSRYDIAETMLGPGPQFNRSQVKPADKSTDKSADTLP